MWAAIRSYWSEQYHAGVVAYYNVGAMVLLRGVLVFPIQLVVLGAIAFGCRCRLKRVPWSVLLVACAVSWPLGGWIDSLGMQYPSVRWLWWDAGPPLACAALLGLALTVVGSAPNSAQQPTRPEARG